MKKHLILLTIAITAIFFLNFKSPQTTNKQIVNPIIGDESFINKFGYQPDENTNEFIRVKTHLEYAEQLLRIKPVNNLSAKQKEQRTNLLNLLHQYHTAGIFPRNYDFKTQRKPCFIDKDGRICAVGYLVEQTAGREIAEQINEKFKYEELLTMNDKTLANWITESGLTKEELATIQPSYGGGPNGEYNYVSKGYGIATSVLSGTNLSSSIVNGIQISKGYKNKTIPVIGLITGATQVSLGVFGMPKQNIYDYTSNNAKRTLSYVNIGLGTASIILSAVNLMTNKNPKPEKSTSWNIYTFPTQSNNLGMAFSFTKRL